MAELKTLMEEEIPEGRDALLESHQNLQKVSAYCTQKYLEDPDKKKVLEETKNFTTQSLASVAYQINTLASNMLNMLDIHAMQLANMESSLNVISQTVDIHKEKVARREIGLLTATKNVSRNPRVIYPNNPDRAIKYIRKPIDYTEYDDIGHGIKLQSRSDSGTMRRHSSVSKKPASPNPDRISVDLNKSGSMSGYSTLRAVKAPTVPQDFNTNPPPQQRISSLAHRRTNSNSSSGSGSIASSTGQYPYNSSSHTPSPSVHRAPSAVSVPPAPPTTINIPPPPPVASSIPPPPPAGIPPPPVLNSSVPPPPPLDPSMIASPEMCPPPPPVISSGVTAQRNTQDSGGYSTPVVGAISNQPVVMDNADSYATTSIMELPPPPGPDMTDIPMPPPPPPMGDSNSMLPPPPPPMPPNQAGWIPDNYLQKMVVLYDYTAMNTDELDLKEDQIVYVIKMNNDGWYEGVIDGVTGLFPGNYVDAV